MNSTFVALLSFLLGGGGGDLLDYVPTESYWKTQEVQVSVQTLGKELEPTKAPDAGPLIADLGSADPQVRDEAAAKILKLGPGALRQVEKAADGPDAEIAHGSHQLLSPLRAAMKKTEVRRLMAIRGLGELRDQKALPLLQPLLASKEMFVADYARSAIAAIEGKPAGHPRSSTARDDVWLLPATCRAVAQFCPRGGGAIDARAVANLPLRPDQERALTVEQLGGIALSAAERLGNVRIEAVSVGASEDLGPSAGFVVAIFSGRLDARTARGVAHDAKIPFKSVAGVEVFQSGAGIAFFLPSDDRLVLLASPAGENYPLEQMLAADRKQDAALKTSREMAALIGSIDTTQPLWAVVKVTDAYRGAIPALETLTLVGASEQDGLRITLRGEGSDEAALKTATADLTRAAAAARVEVDRLLAIVPALQPAVEFFGSVKCDAAGKTLTATAQLKDSPATLFMLPLVLTYGTHHEVVPPPPYPAPATRPAP